MAGWHLKALDHALTQRGWRVVAVHPGNDLNVSASWEIQRSTEEPPLFIDFDGLDDLRCLPLEQSYGCQVRGEYGPSLYFRKNNPLWPRDLEQFVRALERTEPSP